MAEAFQEKDLAMTKKHERVVVAYSGGLDTSVIVKWVLEHRAKEVIAFTADIGQGDDLSQVKQKALDTGASKAVVADLREEFVKDFVFPAFAGHGVYQDHYLLGTAIARPVIGKHLIECAREFGATAICHGATGKGNDQVRFEQTAFALEPEIDIVSPWREWEFKGRADLLRYAAEQGIDVSEVREKPYSMDANLLHVSYEGGILEDPWAEFDSSMFVMTKNPEDAPDKPEYVEIDFESGYPVAVNGEQLSPVALLERLNQIAGKHGIGRVDILEDRLIGLKSRGVYETPGGTLMRLGLHAVESVTLDRYQRELLEDFGPRYSRLIYDGLWFSPERDAIAAMVTAIQKENTGTARLKLYKGAAHVAGRKAPRSLYDEDLASFEHPAPSGVDGRVVEDFRHADAEGFIRLRSLRLRTRARRDRGGNV